MLNISASHYLPLSIIIATFVLLFLAERLLPLRTPRRPILDRLPTNIVMSALALAAGTLTVAPVALFLSAYVTTHRLGILHLAPLPAALQSVLGFVLLDLTFYYWHRLNHRLPLLWRFHNAHHLDPDLDTTTSFRFHFIEILYSTAFRAVQIPLLGVEPQTFAAYTIVFQCCTIFHHSNLRLPLAFERCLNKILVTPRMHGHHHSFVHGETDSNYSVVFRFWDRLHRTLRLNVPQNRITIGVPAYALPGDNRLISLLFLPFRRQRDYWLLPDGSRPTRDLPPDAPAPGVLAE